MVKTYHYIIAAVSVGFTGCGSIEPSSRGFGYGFPYDYLTVEDHRIMDPLSEVAFDRGYVAQPDFAPAGASYRTVMAYIKMMSAHDSVAIILAQNRSSKAYFIVLSDMHHPVGWTREALLTRNAIGRALENVPIHLTKT